MECITYENNCKRKEWSQNDKIYDVVEFDSKVDKNNEIMENIDKKKYQLYSKIKINSESDIIKNNYKKELSEYFKYNSDKKLLDIYQKLKFI